MKVTVKGLAEAFKVDEEIARRVVRMLQGKESPETVEATAEWVRQCYNRPSDDELILHAADVLLGGCGVEGKCTDCGKGIYSYVNVGETYATTLCHTDDEGFFLSCWGDLEEQLCCEYCGNLKSLCICCPDCDHWPCLCYVRDEEDDEDAEETI